MTQFFLGEDEMSSLVKKVKSKKEGENLIQKLSEKYPLSDKEIKSPDFAVVRAKADSVCRCF